MTRLSKIFLVPLILIALFCGFKQISTDNDVFAKSQVFCCNAGYCFDKPCNTECSIRPCSGSEYVSTCAECGMLYYELFGCDRYPGTLDPPLCMP
jgi:hypothetical protein